MNSRERLIFMTNQIARNFATMGHDGAAAATADHIACFWDPRMRAQIFECLAAGGQGLQPAAVAAIRLLHDQGAPPPQTPATQFNATGEGGHSDAG